MRSMKILKSVGDSRSIRTNYCRNRQRLMKKGMDNGMMKLPYCLVVAICQLLMSIAICVAALGTRGWLTGISTFNQGVEVGLFTVHIDGEVWNVEDIYPKFKEEFQTVIKLEFMAGFFMILATLSLVSLTLSPRKLALHFYSYFYSIVAAAILALNGVCYCFYGIHIKSNKSIGYSAKLACVAAILNITSYFWVQEIFCICDKRSVQEQFELHLLRTRSQLRSSVVWARIRARVLALSSTES